MALKFTISSDDHGSLDEVIRNEYKVDTANEKLFHLDVEGAVAKSKVDEFRNTNIEVSKERDTLKTRLESFGDMDPSRYTTLVEMEESFKDKKAMTSEDVQKLVDSQVNEMKATHKTAMESLTTERNTAVNGLDNLSIESDMRIAAKKAGIKPEAIDDVLRRGKEVFKRTNGQTVAYEDKVNNKVLYGKNGIDPKSPFEFVMDLNKSAPHLFQPSDGGAQHRNNANIGGKKVADMSPLEKVAAGLSNPT